MTSLAKLSVTHQHMIPSSSLSLNTYVTDSVQALMADAPRGGSVAAISHAFLYCLAGNDVRKVSLFWEVAPWHAFTGAARSLPLTDV